MRGVETQWRNTTATHNFKEGNAECGDPGLPSFIFCIPNVRLVPYDTIALLPFDARSQTLEQFVVDRLAGCDDWDDSCRTLIRRLNRQYSNQFTDDENLLPRSFAGRLQLPLRGYRLVVSYQDPADKKQIYDVVSKVIDARAAALHVSRDQIAILLTEPVGNPDVQQNPGRVFSEPISGYVAPLKIMHYPYGDTATESELFSLVPVHAAIWDYAADVHHCELSEPGLINPTLSEKPTDEIPPAKASTCGDQRSADYRPVNRFDHGTHIAGILSAPINGLGTAGIVPGMRLWNWEVITSDQFNGGQSPIRKMARDYDIEPRVVNISQTYPLPQEASTSGTIKSALEVLLFGENSFKPGLHSRMLFVAAAGASGTSTAKDARLGIQMDTAINPNCVYPACWSNEPKRGIISVVALSGNGTDLLRDKDGKPLTNFGLAFDVAAVGEVVSTFYGGWFGIMGGSSVATPYVTGLAALIFAKAETNNAPPLNIIDVKQRILFTADNMDSIKGFSRFGRINYRKALNFANDQIRYKNSPQQCPAGECWTDVAVDRTVARSVKIRVANGTLEDGNENPPAEIPFPQVRSITAEAGDLYTIRYVDGGRLKRLESATITLDAKKLVKIGGVSYDFDLSVVEEFVSCSFYDYCPRS